MDYELAKDLMDQFAESTGVTGNVSPRRYLWTDAFAVCNFLGLDRTSGDGRYLQLAVDLVDQVHYVLGRHRQDDPRSGWISGLADEEGARHPTRGGLRIGKTLNERRAHQPPNSRLEWDQDGQYFHYLTKWMHALSRVSRQTGENRYLRWAAELAVTAHQAFTYEISPAAPKRMIWKMSIDLSRPLVDSMGHHDPLDGLITCLELRTSEGLTADDKTGLDAAITDFTDMCRRGHWATDDPLGIGGLLDAAARLAEMVFRRGVEQRVMLAQLLRDAGASLPGFARSSMLDQSTEYRLAFRELGLSIGLHGLPRIVELASQDHELTALAQAVLAYQNLSEKIDAFWSNPMQRSSRAWMDHRDINTVMLATSLAPDGYLAL